MARRLHVCEDMAELAARASRHISLAAQRAVSERGVFTLCLSGGETPAPTYALLRDRASGMPWAQTHVFWGDERCVPLEQPDNHFTMATEVMLRHVALPAQNVHRAHGEAADPAQAARVYEQALLDFFEPPPQALPVFDLVLLGLGEDGHTASIFPDSDGWLERRRLVVDHWVVKRGERVRRLTLTLPVLAAARQVMFLVSGSLKASMLRDVLRGAADVPAAELDRLAAETSWFVDREAASLTAPSTLERAAR